VQDLSDNYIDIAEFNKIGSRLPIFEVRTIVLSNRGKAKAYLFLGVCYFREVRFLVD
jgi:hypothetical protein